MKKNAYILAFSFLASVIQFVIHYSYFFFRRWTNPLEYLFTMENFIGVITYTIITFILLRIILSSKKIYKTYIQNSRILAYIKTSKNLKYFLIAPVVACIIIYAFIPKQMFLNDANEWYTSSAVKMKYEDFAEILLNVFILFLWLSVIRIIIASPSQKLWLKIVLAISASAIIVCTWIFAGILLFGIYLPIG